MPEAPEPAPGEDGARPTIERLPSRFGKFVLERRLARGGMADVYLARLPGAAGFEKELVAKLIRPELSADEAFVQRFVEEAKTSVRLAHPNIVSIFELGVEHGVLYMVMELVRGATLAELLQEGGALRPEEGVYLGLEVVRALDHAHRRGVVHRDVTPGNVMIDDEGAVKLVDFGIATPVHGDSGEVFGTPGHMPPEQLAGGRLGPSVDLFALGTVLVEAWTGRAPFRRADARASRSAMAAGPPPLPSIEHASLASIDDLVLALLAMAPEKRPQHAEDVARRLRTWLRERALDLDEIARGLARRVGPAVLAREARAAGRITPPPAMKRSPRPTPLAEGTRTFATRGGSWTPAQGADEPAPSSAAGTRRIDESTEAEPSHRSSATGAIDGSARSRAASAPTTTNATRPLADDEPGSGTRRLDPEPRASLLAAPNVPEPRARGGSSAWPWLVAALAVMAAVAAWLGRAPSQGVGPTASGSTAAIDPGAKPKVPAAPSASVGPSASVLEPAASTSSAASSSREPSASAVAALAPARLVVASSPPAAVELDGKPIGTTPVSTTATPGEHRLVLKPHGLGETFERRIQAAPGHVIEVKGDFNDEPSVVVRKTPSR